MTDAQQTIRPRSFLYRIFTGRWLLLLTILVGVVAYIIGLNVGYLDIAGARQLIQQLRTDNQKLKTQIADLNATQVALQNRLSTFEAALRRDYSVEKHLQHQAEPIDDRRRWAIDRWAHWGPHERKHHYQRQWKTADRCLRRCRQSDARSADELSGSCAIFRHVQGGSLRVLHPGAIARRRDNTGENAPLDLAGLA